MIEMKTQYPRISDWSMPEPTSTNVMSQNKNNLTNNRQDQLNNQQQTTLTLSSSSAELLSSSAPFFHGLLLGVLSNGLILGIITTLWLTSGNKTTSTSSSTTTTPSIQLRWNSTGITILGTVGVPGAALNQTNLPYGLAFDSSGALYVADYGNNRVQKLTIGTSTVVTVAGRTNANPGNDPSHLYKPVHMAFDSNDNMYLSDNGNQRVQFFIKGNLSGTTVAGITGVTGNGSTQFNGPAGVVYDSNTGNLDIADTYNHRVMQYQNGAAFGTVVAGGNSSGPSTSKLSQPFGLYLDTSSNSLFIADASAQRVVRWTQGDFNWTLIAGSSTGRAGNNSTLLNNPMGMTLDSMGNIYVADSINHRIQLFLSGESNGTTIAGITGVSGTSSTLLNQPYWVALDSQLNLYVSDTSNHRIQMFQRY